MRSFNASHICHSFQRHTLTVTPSNARKLGFLAQKVDHTKLKTERTTVQHENIPQPSPFTLVAPELSRLQENLMTLLGSAHPSLSDMAEYYFLNPSNQLRSLLVLLFARATNGLGTNWELKRWTAEKERLEGRSEEMDRALQKSDVLNDYNPSMPDDTASFSSVFSLRRPTLQQPLLPPPPEALGSQVLPCLVSPPSLLPTQIRLAQITEMIYVASLLHEGITQETETASQNVVSNGLDNKLSILGGDFLLGRASTALSRLGDSEVVELISSVIANRVEGEMVTIDKVQDPESRASQELPSLEAAWELYHRKTYLKTASLMAKSARSAVILGGGKVGMWKEIAYLYGRNLGIAYQLSEDADTYRNGLSDLTPGLATGPALYACEEYPELDTLVQRSFSNQGDIEQAVDYVRRSSGIERTQLLAEAYAGKARDVLELLPDSDSKLALHILTDNVVKRTWQNLPQVTSIPWGV